MNGMCCPMLLLDLRFAHVSKFSIKHALCQILKYLITYIISYLIYDVDILAKCWKKGQITSTELAVKPNTYTTEECQYQCKMDRNCLYFNFHIATNSCKLFDDKASNSFSQHSPILFSPKDCKGD